MKKLFLVIPLLFVQALFGQTSLNQALAMDSKDEVISTQFSPRQHSISSHLKNLTSAKGSIVLDSILYFRPFDDFHEDLFVGIISYDNQNRLSKLVWYEIDTVLGYRDKFEKVEYTYTQSGKPSTKYTYSGIGGSWVKNGGEEYYYKQNDSILQIKFYAYNNGYKPHYNRNYLYDSSNNLIEVYDEQLDFTYSSNFTYYKKRYSYNQNNLLENDTSFEIINNTPYALFARTRTYDSQNRMKTYIFSYYSSNDGWVELSKQLYILNQMNLVDTANFYQKNNQGNWHLNNKRCFDYTASGKVSKSTNLEVINGDSLLPLLKQYNFFTSHDIMYKLKQYKYDTLSQSWKIDRIEADVLDSAENVLYHYNCRYDLQSGNWDSIVNESSVYDLNVNTTNSIFPIIQDPPLYNYDFINANSYNLLKERTIYEKSFFTGSVEVIGHLRFFYSEIPSSYSDLSKESSYKLYPNPAVDQITLEFEKPINNCEIIIYNTFGQIILQKHLDRNTNNNINILELKSGIYFYSIVSEGKQLYSDKFIKQ